LGATEEPIARLRKKLEEDENEVGKEERNKNGWWRRKIKIRVKGWCCGTWGTAGDLVTGGLFTRD
jgi:hypothetical protein